MDKENKPDNNLNSGGASPGGPPANGIPLSNGIRALRPPIPLRTRPVSPLPGETEQYKGRPRHLIISAIVLTVVLSGVMTLPVQPDQVEVREGMPAPQAILSPAYLNYPSKVLTDEARQKALEDPSNQVWIQDTDLVERERSILLNALSIVDDIRQNETLGTSAKQQRLSSLPGITLTPEQVNLLLSLPETDYRYWRDSGVIPGFDAVMKDRRLTNELDVAAARDVLPNLLVPSLSGEQRAAAIAFISPLLAVNMHLDPDQTKARNDAAVANVKPIFQTVQKGEAILRQGELATPEAIEKMQEAGLLNRGISVQNVVGTTGIVALLLVLMHLFIYRYVPQVWRRQKQLILVGMLMVFTVAVARFFLPDHTVLPFALPLASVSMLIAVLLNINLSVLVTFVLSVLLGMTLGNSFSMELPVFYFVGGLAGIFTLTKVERVSAFLRAGFYVSVASFLVALMLRVLGGNVLDGQAIGQLALASIFNGGMSAILTFATFSMLGTLFGITTPLQLMELAHPDQPLLRRLMREAPGTYHHSLVVSNLAEHAAEMIGADSLLTRVSAYYHDIGKSERPYFFIDNQAGRSNVHDELDPWESAQIIAQHVLDGVRLGQQAGLPKRVLDAIPQHHGTMLIKFFYYKALEQNPNANPDDFRYPGPRPQTKETAILMLADGVEATVRSMAQNGALEKVAVPGSDIANSDASESPMLYNDAASLPDDAIAMVVHKIISERIEDGQLDECDLTVRDIARIQEAFVSMLKGIYHPRVRYPEAPKIAVAADQPRVEALPAPANGHVVKVANGHGRFRGRRARLTQPEGGHEQHTPASGV